jgi:hypothetical protein
MNYSSMFTSVAFQILRAYAFEVLGQDPFRVGRRELPRVFPVADLPDLDGPQDVDHNVDPPVDPDLGFPPAAGPAALDPGPDPPPIPPVPVDPHLQAAYVHLCTLLYEGARMTSGNFCLAMSKIKTDHNLPEVAMDELYKLISRVMPVGNVVPRSTYSAKKTLASVGLEYESIHACPQHCILYRGEYEALTECPFCEQPRYQPQTLTPVQVSSGPCTSSDIYMAG